MLPPPPFPLLRMPGYILVMKIRSVGMQTPDSLGGVQTRCIVKGEAQRSPLLGDFLGGFDFLMSACFVNSTRKPFKFNKITDFYKSPL